MQRAEGPPERVAEGADEMPVAGQLAEMLQADEAAAERIEQLHVAEGIGKPERQRDQHHRDDQDDGGRGVEVRLDAALEPSAPAAARGFGPEPSAIALIWPSRRSVWLLPRREAAGRANASLLLRRP